MSLGRWQMAGSNPAPQVAGRYSAILGVLALCSATLSYTRGAIRFYVRFRRTPRVAQVAYVFGNPAVCIHAASAKGIIAHAR